MGEILRLAERAWSGDLGEINVHPGKVVVALEPFDEGLAFMSAFSNALVLATEPKAFASGTAVGMSSGLLSRAQAA